MVSTCRDHARVGTISSSAQHYGDWKDAYPFSDADIQQLLSSTQVANTPKPSSTAYDVNEVPSPAYLLEAQHIAAGDPLHSAITAQERLLAGLFAPANCLDVLQNFTLFETVDGRLIKKIATTTPLSFGMK